MRTRTSQPLVQLAVLCALVAAVLAIPLTASPASALSTTLYVATSGANSSNCQTQATPCATISYAVGHSVSGDTIQVAAGTYQDIVEIPGTISGLTITGPVGGATVDGKSTTAQVGSVFALDNHATATISHLTISQGEGTVISNPSPIAYGDGVFVSSGATVTLNADVITDNVANRDGNDEGGGVFNSGTATLVNDTLSNNSSTNAGGGGILTTSGATTTLTDDTISGNIGASAGGGVYNAGATTLTDDTITGNTAAYTELGTNVGGGVYNAAGVVHLHADTIANNLAAVSGDAIATVSGSTTDVAGTIFGEPGTGNRLCDIVSGSAWADDGYNLSQDATCNLISTSSLPSTNAELGALAANGGPTETMLPASGSPAIDRIPMPTTADGVTLCPSTDQLGTVRPQGPSCDIGSVEVHEAAVPPTISGTPPGALLGTPYNFAFTLGGTPRPTTTVSSGSFPPGLTLTTGGVLTGTPTAVGKFTAKVTASNGVSPIATLKVKITVAPPAALKSLATKGSASAPTITIKGSGFGATAPTPAYPPGPCPDRGTGSLYGTAFYVSDNTAGWSAGEGGADGDGSCIGLVVTHWSNNKIVMNFGTDYPGGGLWVLSTGDSYTVHLVGTSLSATVNY